jgi:hypothetical protein
VGGMAFRLLRPYIVAVDAVVAIVARVAIPNA